MNNKGAMVGSFAAYQAALTQFHLLNI